MDLTFPVGRRSVSAPSRARQRRGRLERARTPNRCARGTGDVRSEGSAYHRHLFEIGTSLAEPRIDPAERPARGAPASLHDLLFDRYADAVLVADADGRYIEANLAATTLLGYSRAELLEKRIPDVLVMSVRG